MRGLRSWLSVRTAVALFVVATILVSTQALSQEKEKTKKGGRPPASVEVAEIIEKEMSASVDLVGSVRAMTETAVSAETTGRVVYFPVREGDRVARGEAVCRLDETIYEIRAREAKGRLIQAIANLRKAELAAKRANELFEEKVASLEMKQNADLDVDAATAAVALSEAYLDHAEYDLERVSIKAPFNGFITKKYIDVGSWVEQGDKIFEIIDISKVEVIAEIPEHLISAATPEKTTQVRFDAYPGRMFEGIIAALAPKANPKTRTFPVRIVLDNPQFLIKAGMFVRVSIPSHEKKKMLLIPRDAVVWRFRKALVFTADGEGMVTAHAVTLGRQYGERVEASGRISAGMKLIVTGNEVLRDGQTVRVVGEKKI